MPSELPVDAFATDGLPRPLSMGDLGMTMAEGLPAGAQVILPTPAPGPADSGFGLLFESLDQAQFQNGGA